MLYIKEIENISSVFIELYKNTSESLGERKITSKLFWGFTPKDKRNIIAKRKFFLLLKMERACEINCLYTCDVTTCTRYKAIFNILNVILIYLLTNHYTGNDIFIHFDPHVKKI